MHEERRALFSCFYWAIFSWNRDEMRSQGEPPQLALWARLLVRFYSPVRCSDNAWGLTLRLCCSCSTRVNHRAATKAQPHIRVVKRTRSQAYHSLAACGVRRRHT